jgi:hypothetical protein
MILGPAGDAWANNTGHVWWQLVCSLERTCGYCLPLHLAIADFWYVPFHGRCRCHAYPVPPDTRAQPFPDFRALIQGLTPDQRTSALGRSVDRLLGRGAVDWPDIIDHNHVLPLHEIVRRAGLKLSDLLKAGVPRHIAELAMTARPMTADQLIAAHRAALHRKVDAAGLTAAQLAAMALMPEDKKKSRPKPPAPTPPADVIREADQIVRRLQEEDGDDPDGLPDFNGDAAAMVRWVNESFAADMLARLTTQDWMVLTAAVAAHADLMKVFKRLKIDPERAMPVIKR